MHGRTRRMAWAQVSFLLVALATPHSVSVGEAAQPWQLNWEESLKEAEKEGQVTIYAGVPFSGYYSVLDAFQKTFPKIKANLLGGRGSQLGPRILAEHRASKYLADLFIGGKGTAFGTLYVGKVLDPIKSLLVLPEVTDESNWWQGKHKYLDPEHQYVFVFVGNPGWVEIAFNNRLVDPKQFRSYWDLLDSKWKGRIVAVDPRVRGADTPVLFFYYTPTLGPSFIRRLFGEMDMTFFRDYRQPVDRLAQGRFSLCIPCTQTEIDAAIEQGLPLGQTDPLKEGYTMTSGGLTMSLIKHAPHPQAAKVFVNWLLSREGQTALQRVEAPREVRTVQSRPNSLRIDIPKDDIPKERRRIEGAVFFDGDDPQFSDRRPADKLFNEILK